MVVGITMDKNTKCVMMALGSDIAGEAQRSLLGGWELSKKAF